MIASDYKEPHELPALPAGLSTDSLLVSALTEGARKSSMRDLSASRYGGGDTSGIPRSPTKSVVINLPEEPPSKRMRTHTNAAPIDAVVTGISSSVNHQDRIKAIRVAQQSFDHGIQLTHDREISAGADIALCKHLSLLLYKAQSEEMDRERHAAAAAAGGGGGVDSSRTTTPDPVNSIPDLDPSEGGGVIEEMGSTCEVMEAVYRCSADTVATSFARLGTELLPMLIKITNHEVRRRRDHQAASAATSERDHHQLDPLIDARDLILKKTTKIMGHFARIGSLTQPLAYHPGLLSCLRRVISCPIGIVPRECRLNALWIVANLACNAENMVMMACHPGLLETLVGPAHRAIENEEAEIGDIDLFMEALRSRDIAIRAIFNLSWAPENKLLLSEHANLVEALLRTLMYRVSSWGGFGRGVSGILLQSRKHAACALRNLAAAPRRNKQILCRQVANGTLLDKVSDSARNDPDSEVREKALAALNNLACSATAEEFVKRVDCLEILTDSALLETDNEEGGTASHALRVLEKSIPEDDENYALLKPYLDKVSAANQDMEGHEANEGARGAQDGEDP